MGQAMGRILTNDFSWSKSRHEKFSECLRAYYLYYYRSWGGWDARAPADVRELYVLKKLNNRYTWAGGVVHDAIKQALLALRAGRTVAPEQAIARVHRLMQADFKHSAARAYWKEKLRKEFAGLVEHEYAVPVANDEWKANWNTARSALEWFFNSRWPALARSLRPEQWLEVDEGFEFSSFQVEGVKVFAIPDFAYYDDQGRAIVVDWKTGKARDGYDDQVLGYALYIATRYKLPVEKVRAQLVYLNDGVESSVEVDSTAIAGFRQRMRASVEKMRDLLADPPANLPRPETHFPMTDALQTCTRCVFRRICGRENLESQVA
jgi:hypothetical protein